MQNIGILLQRPFLTGQAAKAARIMNDGTDLVQFQIEAVMFVIVFKGTVGGADKNLDLEIKER